MASWSSAGPGIRMPSRCFSSVSSPLISLFALLVTPFPHQQFLPGTNFHPAIQAAIISLAWFPADRATTLRVQLSLLVCLPRSVMFSLPELGALADWFLPPAAAFQFPFEPAFDESANRLPAGQQLQSIGGLAIHEPLALNHRHEIGHAFAICLLASVPAVFKFAGVFRKVFTADAVPSAKHAAL